MSAGEAAKLRYAADAIPGVLSVSANVSAIPAYPLIGKLEQRTHGDAAPAQQCPLNINYVVSSKAASNGPLKGKSYEAVTPASMRLETPLGRFGRLSVMLDWHETSPTLFVNKTYHRLARATIGNVHSTGWLARDLTNVLLLLNGYALLHAAALRYGERLLVMVGLSNTGKTKTVFSLVQEHGGGYYGDDLILTDGERIYSCPFTGVNVDPAEGPGIRYRIEQRLRRSVPFFENVVGGYAHCLVDVLGRERCANAGPITDLIIMMRPRRDGPTLRAISPTMAGDLLLASNRTEFTFGASAVLFASEFLQTGVLMGNALANEETLLRRLASSANCYYGAGSPEALASMCREILRVSGDGKKRPTALLASDPDAPSQPLKEVRAERQRR